MFIAARTRPTSARLAEVADLADQRDRLMGRLVRLLVSVSSADELAGLCGGMSLHVWLQHTARCTHAEARDLLGAAETLGRMPAVLAGSADRWLSWSQTLSIARAARAVPVRLRSQLDELVGSAMVSHAGWEPDALVADVWQWVDTHQPSRLQQAEAAAGRDRFLALSPQPFGGGSVYGELDRRRRALTRGHGRRTGCGPAHHRAGRLWPGGRCGPTHPGPAGLAA